MPSWFALVELVTAAIASALWYLFPGLGPWPLLIGLAPWALRLLRTGRPLRLTGFEVPLALFLLTAGASVWAAYAQAAAWAKFWQIVGGVLLFYGFAGIGGEEGIGDRGSGSGKSGLEVGAWALAGFGAAVAVYFLSTHDWDRFDVKIAALERVGRALQRVLPALPGHKLHPNVAGGLLAMAAPFAGALVVQGVRRWRAGTSGQAGEWRRIRLEGAFSAFLLALILFGLLLTVSRGAWLGLGAAAVAAGLWFLLGLVGLGAGRRRWALLALAPALGIALLLGAVLRPEATLALLDRLPGGAGLGRLTLYRDGLTLAGDYPFVGAGLDGFMMLYSTYQLLVHVGFSVHAHNLLLDVAIEQGMAAAGVLGMMWVGMGIGWKWEVGSRKEEGSDGLWVGAALLALTTVAVHGLVDDAFYGSRAVILLFVPLAFAVPALRRAGWARRLNLGIAGLALAVAALAALVPALRADALANLGAVEQGRAELSVYEWPEWRLQDEVRRQVDLEPALARYEQALALAPDNFSANRRMGQIALSLGRYEDALAYLERAYAAAPWDNATRQLYGEALIANGQVEAGAALWATVNNGQNQLGARLFWYEHIGDEARRQAVQRAIPQ